MENRSVRNVLRLLTLVSLLGIVPLTAQVGERTYPWKGSLLNVRGWHFPGQEWMSQHPIAKLTRTVEINRTEVTQSWYILPLGDVHNPAVVIPMITLGQTNIVKYDELRLVATDVWAYGVSGRVFCYDITAVPLGCDEAGNCGYAGAGYLLAVYDEDGDGRFETMTKSLRSSPDRLELVVPDWVRESGTRR